MAKRKAPKTAWKPGQSGNPSGRAKVVQDYVGQRLHLYVKALEEIALGKVINYELEKIPALKGMKPEQLEGINPFEFRKESDQIKALENLCRIADAYPKDRKVDVKVDLQESPKTAGLSQEELLEVMIGDKEEE